MSYATSLFLRGFLWGAGAGAVVMSMMTAWSAFVKSANSI